MESGIYAHINCCYICRNTQNLFVLIRVLYIIYKTNSIENDIHFTTEAQATEAIPMNDIAIVTVVTSVE